MNQSTKLSLQKGGSCEKTGKIEMNLDLDTMKVDYLIDTAIVEWVEAHPEEMQRYIDNGCILRLFKNAKVIYL